MSKQIKLKFLQSLKSASHGNGNSISIKTYDDGFGPLWAVSNCFRVIGIIRAETWEDAWSIAEDEIFPRASENDMENFEKDYGPDWSEDCAWNESYGFSGSNGIYEKDLNGDYLNPLTEKNVEEWGITLEIETEVEPEPEEEFFIWHTSRYVNPNGRCVFSIQGRYSPYSRVSPPLKVAFNRPSHSHFSPQDESLTLILNP